MPQRVLIIDDDKDTVLILSLLLQAKGYDALTACEGTEALSIAAKERPNVVLLDLGLPGMDGLEVCRRLREEPGGKDLQIIAITGWGRASDTAAAIAAGCDLHLTKPVNFATLQKALKDGSGGPSAAAPSL